MTAVTKPKKRGPMDLVLISFFSFLVISTPSGLFNIAWTYMHETFDAPLANLGVFMSVGVVGGLLMSFSSGRFVGWLGVGWTLILATVIHLGGMTVTAIAPSWAVLLIGKNSVRP